LLLYYSSSTGLGLPKILGLITVLKWKMKELIERSLIIFLNKPLYLETLHKLLVLISYFALLIL
jgi:hypothetical protein